MTFEFDIPESQRAAIEALDQEAIERRFKGLLAAMLSHAARAKLVEELNPPKPERQNAV